MRFKAFTSEMLYGMLRLRIMKVRIETFVPTLGLDGQQLVTDSTPTFKIEWLLYLPQMYHDLICHV